MFPPVIQCLLVLRGQFVLCFLIPFIPQSPSYFSSMLTPPIPPLLTHLLYLRGPVKPMASMSFVKAPTSSSVCWGVSFTLQSWRTTNRRTVMGGWKTGWKTKEDREREGWGTRMEGLDKRCFEGGEWKKRKSRRKTRGESKQPRQRWHSLRWNCSLNRLNIPCVYTTAVSVWRHTPGERGLCWASAAVQ